jgi:hypothetical protein
MSVFQNNEDQAIQNNTAILYSCEIQSLPFREHKSLLKQSA